MTERHFDYENNQYRFVWDTVDDYTNGPERVVYLEVVGSDMYETGWVELAAMVVKVDDVGEPTEYRSLTEAEIDLLGTFSLPSLSEIDRVLL